MSTFSNLFSKEMKKGQNPFDAATTAYTNTIRKSLGLKEYSPKGGLLGGFMSSKASGKKMESSVAAASLSSASIRIVAKNSMSLPVIAKEMNIMRQNIQLMVKKQGLTPKSKSDATITSVGQTSTVPSASKSSKGGFFESAGSTLKSAGGGLLSITSGIVSGLFGVLGAAGSSFLGMFSGLGMSPLMMIAAGYIVSILYRAIPFKKIGSDFQKIFNDALNGLSNFFGIDLTNVFGDSVEKLKKFFGMSEDEGFLDVVAKKLDETFKTTFFTTNLNKASNILLNAAEDTGIFLQNAFSSIMKYVAATAMTTGDMFGALAKDVKSYMRLWLDSNKQELYMIIGAVLGTAVGSVIPGIGSVVGGFLGASAGGEYAKFMKAENSKLIKTFGDDLTGNIEKRTRTAQLINQLLDFTKNEADTTVINPDADANSQAFFRELEKATGLSHYHYQDMYRQKTLTVDYFKKQLRANERVKDVLELEALKRSGGSNSLQNFDIRTAQSKNLESSGQMFPEKPYPTRVFPVDNPRMPKGSSEYLALRNNSLGQYQHAGVDYHGSIGDPIYAMQEGTVQVKNDPKGLGKYIIIRGVNGGSTIYGHISESLVETNDKVSYGQQIAKMGDSGNASGKPQLHFEAYKGNPFESTRLDPSEFLKGLPARPTMESTSGNKNSLISDVTQSAEKNFIDPLVKKFDEMIAAFMSKDTNVVVNTSSESIPAEPYSEEQLSHYKLSGINF